MAKRKLKVVSFPETETAAKVKRLYKSVDDFVGVMRELKEVERMTARDCLSERAYVAFTSVMMDALNVVNVESKEGRKPRHAMDT